MGSAPHRESGHRGRASMGSAPRRPVNTEGCEWSLYLREGINISGHYPPI